MSKFDMDAGERKIKFYGPVDFFGLYNLIAGWMTSKGCVVYNPLTKHKITPQGLEYEFKIEGIKKETEFYKDKMMVEFIIKEAREVELIRNGVKKKMFHGILYVTVSGKLVTDMQGMFVNSKFEDSLLKFMSKYVTKEKTENFYYDRLDYKLIELQTEIKKFIGMNSKGNAFHDMW